MYLVHGTNGQIKLIETRIIISRQGAGALLTQGAMNGTKEIPIKNITGVQLKEAAGAANGFIQFSIIGGMEAGGGFDEAMTDENTVMFRTSQTANFKEIKRYIDSIIDGMPLDFETLSLPKEGEKTGQSATSGAAYGKSYSTALILSILLGGFGVDRFYLGYIGLGIAKFLTGGGCFVWWLIDIIFIATGKMKDVDGNDLVK